MIEDILICPKSKRKITIDAENRIALVKDSGISYPINDGIIDFIPDKSDRISKVYDSFALSYDNYANLASFKWKLFALFAWGFLDDKHLIEKMLLPIPDDFDGVLLDVPVGTGIATVKKYSKIENARIIVIDYSLGMLKKAQHLYAENGIKNVTFIRGDVGNLPIENASIDLCLSMGGFHVFLDKDAALNEIVRVLKDDKIFTGGFFIRGKRLLTDILVWLIFSRKGYFTRPFYSEQEYLKKLGEYFNFEYTDTMKSCFVFASKKKKNMLT